MENGWIPSFGDVVQVKECADARQAGMRINGKQGSIVPSWIPASQVHDGHSLAVAFFSYKPRHLRGEHGQYVWHFRPDELELVRANGGPPARPGMIRKPETEKAS